MTTIEPTVGHRTFHDKLDSLKKRLVSMSERSEAQLEAAVDSFLRRDPDKATAVLDRDEDVDALEVEIETIAISLLALQQPMAKDLRFIISAIKITGDLERVGDHGVNIAQAAIRMSDLRALIVPPPEIREMAYRARKMLSDALDAVVRQDAALGREVCKRDDQVDALHESVFRIMLTHMMEDPATISASLELLLVSRNLERVADLATNIAEDAVFLVEGKSIKHHLEERQGAAPKG
jgi:phosphate transport system protein